MEQFLSTLVFVLPGLLAYYWMCTFRLTPSQKHSSFEMLSISILLWVPVTFLNLGLYNILVFVMSYVQAGLSAQMQGNFPDSLLGFLRRIFNSYVYRLDQIQMLSNSLAFLVFYIVSSAVTSYILARLISYGIYDLFLDHVNAIRKKHNLSGFSKHSSVWGEFFGPYGSRVVEVSKIDDPEKKIIGCLRKASRPTESERNIVLDDIEYFTELVEKRKIPVARVFIDIKSGIIIKEFDRDEIEKAQKKD